MCDNKTRHVIALGPLKNNGMKGKVTGLDRLKYLFGVCLGGNYQLTGEISQLLRMFKPYLLRFHFSFTSIHGKLPDTIATDKPLLGKIQLSGSIKITGELPQNIGDLKNLQVLSIGETRITGKIPPSIAELQKLWFLDLEQLYMKGTLSILQNMTSLRYIHLKINQLSGNIPFDLGIRLPHLIEIQLQTNLLSGVIPDSIGRLKRLKVLNLANNDHIHEKLPASLNNLTNLQYLDISHTGIIGLEEGSQLTSVELSHFIARSTQNFSCSVASLVEFLHSGNRSLLHLDVQDSGIFGIFEISEIFLFKKIIFINLSGNKKLTGGIPNLGYSHPNLATLNVSNCNLSGSLPLSFLLKTTSLIMLDLRGNSMMKGTIDRNSFDISRSTLSKEKITDRFSCPAITYRENQAIVKLDYLYYDRKHCQCNVGYYGIGGYCKTCLKPGGKCFQRRLTETLNYEFDRSLDGGYFRTNLQIDKGYWPFPRPSNTQQLVECPSSRSGKKACNPEGFSSCHLQRTSDRNKTYFTNCSTAFVCLEGHQGRLCSVCKNTYYKDGIECKPCTSNNLNGSEILGIIITLSMLAFVSVCIFSFARSEKMLISAMVLTETIIILTLRYFAIVPGWMAKFNLLVVAVVVRSLLPASIKGFLKIGIVYFQVTDATVSTSHIWSPTAYNVQAFASSAFNLRFSSFACILPLMFTPKGRLAFLLSLRAVMLVGCGSFYWIWFILKGRKHNKLAQKCKYQFSHVYISFINLIYFRLAKTVLSVLTPCRQVGRVSFMTNYPWLDCGTKKHQILFVTACLAVPVYIFPGIPAIFLLLLYRNRNKLKTSDDQLKMWLRSLYVVYKPEYRLFMEVVVLFRRLIISAILCLVPHDLNQQMFLITTVFVLSIGFEANTMPYTTWKENVPNINNVNQPRNTLGRKLCTLGFENIVNILSLSTMLLTFVMTRSNIAAESNIWTTPLFWVLVAFNIMILVLLFAGICVRMTQKNTTQNEAFHSSVNYQKNNTQLSVED